MADMTTTPTATPAPTDKRKRQYAEQDQRIANDISDVAEMLGVAKTDTEIGPLMATKGYDAAELTAGSTLHGAAETTFGERQKAMAKSDKALELFTNLEQSARQDYADFRETARVKFNAAADQAALGLNGRVPKDLQKFITSATASYTGAQGAAYAPELTKVGYPPANITAAITALKALGKAHADFTSAEADAVTATKARDTAHKDMMKWAKSYRRLGRIALRSKPALRAKIGA